MKKKYTITILYDIPDEDVNEVGPDNWYWSGLLDLLQEHHYVEGLFIKQNGIETSVCLS